MEVIVGATIGAIVGGLLLVYVIIAIIRFVYGTPKQMIVVMDNTGIEVPEGSVIPVTLGGRTPFPNRSPTQIAENIATAFPAEIPQSRKNALAEEIAMLRARPNGPKNPKNQQTLAWTLSKPLVVSKGGNQAQMKVTQYRHSRKLRKSRSRK